MELYIEHGQKRWFILEKIIDQVERSTNDWRGDRDGNRSGKVQQSDYDNAGGKSKLVREAVELEQDGLIRVKWYSYGSEIETITFRLRDMPRIYEIVGKESKKCRLEKAEKSIRYWADQAESLWLKEYYGELFGKIEKGKYPDDLTKYGEILFRCFNALEKLKEPVFIRIFSTKYLGGSKVFEETLKSRVVSIGKKYHPMIDEAMSEYEILSQLYLEYYAQELELKGELCISLNGVTIDLGMFPYGLVLNSETLKTAGIVCDQKIRKIVTVENKANYMSMPYEKGTLILFCHGFFSPRERGFLCKLEQVLKAQRESGTEIEYYHTGDLDYGGVRIFQYIRTKIFPLLRPLDMDAAQYDRYLEYGDEMEASAWEKLKRMEEPLLQPLIERILEERKVVEQECFLF